MKNRIGFIFLILICLALGIALIAIKKGSVEEERRRADEVFDLSNKVVNTDIRLGFQIQTNTIYERDLESQRKVINDLTNNLTQVSANLVQANANLAKSEAALKAANEEIKKRDERIAGLENENQALDKRTVDLSTSITNLTVQIEDTRKKLAASEGDRAVLETNLKRLLAEKSELERQFNDLTVLRAQVTKLKEELTIARRLDWIRQGLFAAGDQKGAQKLMQPIASVTPSSRAVRPNYDLNVEVSSDGNVRVVPAGTNRPAAANPPVK